MTEDNIAWHCRREAQAQIDAGIGDGWPLTQAAATIEAQQAEIERLRRWKAEAVEVLKEWDALAGLVEARLGDRKSDAVAVEIERLRAALALAVGELSTHGQYAAWSPDQLMQQFLEEACRG